MTQNSYTVLARRYRPTRLSDLIGQDVLQKTLTEAIEKNHLPHAILLHGIRGVGKTTTARIIARSLNCIGPDGKGDITPDPCGVCASCVDIQNDRHLDVIEIDAASHTSVDNIREITESARYKAVKGRFKIFIIDEVHMLSKSAFNALLKTLEEPPAHVKFIFATTELKKIPDTVLSRCMRFDLKRMDAAITLEYLQKLCDTENIKAEIDALGIIARAGDGSMRDSLSLLDQAIALSLSEDNGITTSLVEQMLGATNKSHIINIVSFLFQGNTGELIALIQRIFHDGADPLLLAQEIMEYVYWLTCAKVTPSMLNDPTWPVLERNRGAEILTNLDLPSLARAWQVLSKGYEEIQENPLPQQACIMVMIRLCHMGLLPSIERIIETFQSGGSIPTDTNGSVAGRQNTFSGMGAMPSDQNHSVDMKAATKELKCNLISEKQEVLTPSIPLPTTFRAVVDMLKQNRYLLLADQLENEAHVIDYKQCHITLGLDMVKFSSVPTSLRKVLQQLTGVEWTLTITSDLSGKTLKEEQMEYANNLVDQAKHLPFVKEILNLYPNTTLKMETIYETT